jgi:UDP-N-acetyl-D-mannosaminuronic acid dehydrogenase
MKQVCILGLGYIGLPTASVLANRGFDVQGVDIREEVVSTIGRGETHILEPDLEILVRAAVNSGKLKVSTRPTPADVFILAVPTPLKNHTEPELSYVEAATETLVPHLRKGNLVILESTSPPGTCEKILKPILKKSGLDIGKDVFLAHCPERVLPGRILQEVVENDRIIGEP